MMKVGQSVICNGFPGTITEVCTDKLVGMVVVRLQRGTVCVDATQVVPVDHGLSIKITEHHRQLVACYYSQLLYRFGKESLLRKIPVLKRIVWTRSGRNLVERRCT